jgi:hypothetical protein
MLRQFETLERRTGHGTGKDSVDHPVGLHDDVSNAVAGALCLALRESGSGWGWAAQGARAWIEAGRPTCDSTSMFGRGRGSAPETESLGRAQLPAAQDQGVFGAQRCAAPVTVSKPAPAPTCPMCSSGLAVYLAYRECRSCGWREDRDTAGTTRNCW